MVMERFSEDMDQVFQRHDRHFDITTVLMLGLRIVSKLVIGVQYQGQH